MLKIIPLFLILLFFSSGANAMKLKPWMGVSNISMLDVNHDNSTSAENWQTAFTTTTSDTLNYSPSIGLDGDFFRLAYVTPGLAGYSVEAFGSTIVKRILTVSLVSAEIGYTFPSNTKTGFSMGIFAGYCYSIVDMSRIDLFSSIEHRIPYRGTAPIAEFLLGIHQNEVVIEIGFRQAKISEVEVPQDTDSDGDGDTDILKGEVLETINNPAPLVFDYSGITVNIGLKFGGQPPAYNR